MDAKEARPKLGLDDSEFKSEASGRTRPRLTLRRVVVSGGGLIGAITLGLGSMLPGLGGAVAGMGLLGATGLAAFGGIGKALSAHSQASAERRHHRAQMAATSFSERCRGPASAAGGQPGVQAGRGVRDHVGRAAAVREAQLAETVRNAAQSQSQAFSPSPRRSSRSSRPRSALIQAQYNLSMAWIQARYRPGAAQGRGTATRPPPSRRQGRARASAVPAEASPTRTPCRRRWTGLRPRWRSPRRRSS